MSIFCGYFLINLGGRSTSDGDNLPIEIYDTETSEWHCFSNFRRFRHSTFIIESSLYVHGGLEDEKNNSSTNAMIEINLLELFKPIPTIEKKLRDGLEDYKKKLQSINQQNNQNRSNASSSNGSNNDSQNLSTSYTNSPNSKNDGKSGKELHFAYHGEVANIDKKGEKDKKQDLAEMVRRVSLDRIVTQESYQKKQSLIKQPSTEVHELVINLLLRPKDWLEKSTSECDVFPLNQNILLELVANAIKVVENQPMVLRLEAPIKIFGDIHGQYQDLMRFFDLYNAPIESPGGDIEGLDYLFLGDYVDRGTHSLETICLLMALKIKYPNQIHLLRGNHEDRWINAAFGFQTECIQRLNDDPENPKLFFRFNDFFDYLPLAAIINETVLCIHGGIGSAVNTISDIEKIKRPLEVIHEVSNIDQQIVVDILWSDPTDNDSETGIQPNTTRDPTGVGNIVKFGPDRVQEFLKNNGLSLIIRAHECVMDGFERFAGGQLMTVFSATDYCGKHKNAGAILYLTKSFEIKPYLIYPFDTPNKNWDNSEEAMKIRPPTPPRSRNDSAGNNPPINNNNNLNNSTKRKDSFN